MIIFKPLPALPADFGGQPSVVSAFDDIRFTINDEERAESRGSCANTSYF